MVWLFSRLIGKQFFNNMLEDCVCEVGIDVGEGNADHFICLFVLRNLIDEAIGESLRKTGELFLIESEQEGEEDV